MQIYSVVVTYNAEQYIDGCIGGLLNSDIENTVVVVDNASTDNTVELIRENFPEVVLLLQNINVGFGRANNIGIELALSQGTDFVFLLNQDAIVKSDTLSTLLAVFSQFHNSYGILSPLHLNADGSNLDYQWEDYYLTKEKCPTYFKDLTVGELKPVYEMKFVNAAAWMITKECLKRVGGFNSFYFMYAEDLDYVNRLKFKDFKIGFVPSSEIRHLREKRESTGVDRSRKLFMRKFFLLSTVDLMNPNLSMFSAFIKVAKKSGLSAIKSIGKGEFKESIFHVFLPLRVIWKWGKLKSNRKESLSTNYPHLDYR